MNKKLRRPMIAANWKMNMTPTQTQQFIEALGPQKEDCRIVLCVPYLDIPVADFLLKDSPIALGAQNLHWARSGAYTGEVSGDMLTAFGVEYVIVGHSERRQYFGETDAIVNQKVHAALNAGFSPILCVGENLDQRNLGVTLEHIAYQLKIALSGVSPEDMGRVVVAYEPIWAIGTGNTATPEQAGEVCSAIRSSLRGLFGDAVADRAVVLYGGSMNERTSEALLRQEDVDGGLIGTASLDPEKLRQIIQTAERT